MRRLRSQKGRPAGHILQARAPIAPFFEGAGAPAAPQRARVRGTGRRSGRRGPRSPPSSAALQGWRPKRRAPGASPAGGGRAGGARERGRGRGGGGPAQDRLAPGAGGAGRTRDDCPRRARRRHRVRPAAGGGGVPGGGPRPESRCRREGGRSWPAAAAVESHLPRPARPASGSAAGRHAPARAGSHGGRRRSEPHAAARARRPPATQFYCRAAPPGACRLPRSRRPYGPAGGAPLAWRRTTLGWPPPCPDTLPPCGLGRAAAACPCWSSGCASGAKSSS